MSFQFDGTDFGVSEEDLEILKNANRGHASITPSPEGASVAIVTLNTQDDDPTCKVYRIDFRNGIDCDEWRKEPAMQRDFITLSEDKRLPNVHITIHHQDGRMENYNLAMEKGRLAWWLSLPDVQHPASGEGAGRPMQRCLELITSRQRRTKKPTIRL